MSHVFIASFSAYVHTVANIEFRNPMPHHISWKECQISVIAILNIIRYIIVTIDVYS